MDDFVFFFLLDEYTLINKELDTSGIDHINIIQLSELILSKILSNFCQYIKLNIFHRSIGHVINSLQECIRYLILCASTVILRHHSV